MSKIIQIAESKGLAIMDWQKKEIERKHKVYGMPDDELELKSKEYLRAYLKALYLTSCEMAREWTEGFSILETLGFERIERKVNHRTFIKLQYTVNKNVN